MSEVSLLGLPYDISRALLALNAAIAAHREATGSSYTVAVVPPSGPPVVSHNGVVGGQKNFAQGATERLRFPVDGAVYEEVRLSFLIRTPEHPTTGVPTIEGRI